MKKSIFIIIISFFTYSAASQNWESFGEGLRSPVRGMYSDTVDNYLYASGGLYEDTTQDGRILNGVARWDGVKWDSMGNGFNDGAHAFAMARYHNYLYFGGIFKTAGNLNCKGIGIWDGANWDTLTVQPFKRTTYNHAVFSMAVIDDELYFGGVFDSVNNLPSRCFAKWNGTSIIPIGVPQELNFVYIYSICEYNGYIYVGGNFSTALANDTLEDIMRFDGTNWSSVGGGMKGSSSFVNKMAVYNNELYVGGYFDKASGNAGDNIQKWNGSTWSEVGGGVNVYINDMEVFNNKLYVGGGLTDAGGVPVQMIASWDGTDWCGLGGNFDNIISNICVYKDSLCIAGGFWTIDGDSVNHVAKWIGGNYVDTCGNIPIGISEQNNIKDNVIVYPNPANERIIIEFELGETAEVSIELKNILGQTVKNIVNNFTTGKNMIELNLNEFPNGLYFVQLPAENKIITKKFIKQ